MSFTLNDFAPAKPRKARRAGSTGRTLEKLVLASQSKLVWLRKVPNGMGYGRGGKTFRTKSPVDFFGVAYGRPIVFDCKECGEASFDASTAHLADHQRLMLLEAGEAGAVAGLLILATRTDAIYWLSWTALRTRRPTYPWAQMEWVGSGKWSVNWPHFAAAVMDGDPGERGPADGAQSSEVLP